MNPLKLYMLLLGCKPAGRNTEQHDVFFGIGEKVSDLVFDLINFWPEANKKIHLDAWRQIEHVDGYKVELVPQPSAPVHVTTVKLFFINLGGYKPAEFDEFHYKMVVAANDKAAAVAQAKKTAFYRHTGFPGAGSHIDDKYGIDVDDLFEIGEILPPAFKSKYSIVLTPTDITTEDKVHLGYMKLDSL